MKKLSKVEQIEVLDLCFLMLLNGGFDEMERAQVLQTLSFLIEQFKRELDNE